MFFSTNFVRKLRKRLAAPVLVFKPQAFIKNKLRLVLHNPKLTNPVNKKQ